MITIKKLIIFLLLLLIIPSVISLSITGGNITTDGAYIVHTFLTDGNFYIDTGNMNVTVLIVAGGGGGGTDAGGGGAGGLIYNTSYDASGNITVTVGDGGTGGPSGTGSGCGTSGTDSIFGVLTAVGGGAGSCQGFASGKVGGSGGGGRYNSDGSTGTTGQGNQGGAGLKPTIAPYSGGGGGGAGDRGGNATGLYGGNGGAGSTYSINGSSVCYAGGGGGGTRNDDAPVGVGGGNATCGGGNGGAPTVRGSDAINGTGGGGGGPGGYPFGGGGKGGDGVVIVRYLSATSLASTFVNQAPTNNTILERQNYGNLITTVSTNSVINNVNITFYNAVNNNSICNVTANLNTTPINISCNWTGLTAGQNYSWYAKTLDDVIGQSDIWYFTPNNEPGVLNLRIEEIQNKLVSVRWDNEPNMEWISLRIGSDILEVRDLTSNTSFEWNVSVLYPNYQYIFEWQVGDNLRSTSDYYNFSFRSTGWAPDLSNYRYKKLITVNHSQIVSDAADYVLNLSLTEDNFQYFDSVNYVYYPAFKHLNYTNGNDIRFTDYYETTFLPYQIDNWNVYGEGGVQEQTLPNATNFSGIFVTLPYAHDGNWLTQASPNPEGVDYYNYTIPVGAKTTSKFRIYDGAWGWDIDIPVGCFGSTDLEFKSIANTTPVHVVKTYCRDVADPTTWNLVRDNLNVSYYIYETMVTWEFNSQVNMAVQINHFNDSTQSNTPGLDSDYDQKLWIYYGYVGAVVNSTTLTPLGYSLPDIYTIGSETTFTPNAPVISNVTLFNQTLTGISINWTLDQPIDSRIEYAKNPWILNSTWASSLVNYTENITHIKGNINTTVQLYVRGPYYVNMVSVTSTNSTHSANYTVNSAGTGPVNITFIGTDDTNYQDWLVIYTMNKTIIWSNSQPEFTLSNLDTNTQYYYRLWAYGTTLNSSYNGSFTLGTVPVAPISIIYNYTENRPASQVTVCGELTDLSNATSVNCSIEYFNEDSTMFGETTPVELFSPGIFCNVINVDYGHYYGYRTKCIEVINNVTQYVTGGTETTLGNYTIRTFINNDTLSLSSGTLNAEVLVVAGGGGGGGAFPNDVAGGGGGGGELIYNSTYIISGNITVVIGDGGAVGGIINNDDQIGKNGGNSVFGVLMAIGGGGGGGYTRAGQDGASGGGGASGAGSAANGTPGLGTVGKGYNGGSCYTGDFSSAGGGGAGSNGTNCSASNAGTTGGIGIVNNITGVDINYSCGGGGAGKVTRGVGGCSNAGNGSISATNGNGSSGVANTGSGGGGSYMSAGTNFFSGGIGGSGVVIVKYLTPTVFVNKVGYSDAYYNEFMSIQPFFAGNFIEDDMDYLDRQYCSLGDCYNQTGYREGSLQEEDWIWIESNITSQGTLSVNWWNGTNWDIYIMSNDTDTDMKYLQLEGLGGSWQTFYITGDSGLVLNWTKPSLTHLDNQNRTDESKYVAFGGTPAAIDYQLLYMDSQMYNTSAYRYCVAAGGSFYDCMLVQYWGGGQEAGLSATLSGTEYDRGQLFRGGVINGELRDTGILTPVRNTTRNLTNNDSNERYCFAFTNLYWDYSIVPNNNITNYYYHYWTQNQKYSEYLGIDQDRTFDMRYLSNFETDELTQSRDWSPYNGTIDYNENVVQNATGANFSSAFNESLMAGYVGGFEADIGNDKIYALSFYTDGRWTNQQFGPHQQAFVIFNLPDNTTLQGLDSDSDSLTDFDELYVYYTNPKSNDTDEDGWNDGYEITNGYDPNLHLSPGPPTIINSTILPTVAYYNDTLLGYCGGTNLQMYNYIWYKNGVEVENGTITTNSSNINVDNLTGFVFNDNIMLSCQAENTVGETTDYLNSSVLTISNTPPVTTQSYILPTVAYVNDTLIGYCNGTDANNQTLSYNYSWYLDGVLNNSAINSIVSTNGNVCYQESANISNQTGTDGGCNQQYNGVSTGDFIITNVNDGDWNTATYGLADVGRYYYVNYTKPPSAINLSLIQYKDSEGIANYTLSDCWSTYSDKLSFRISFINGPYCYKDLECANSSTTWKVLKHMGSYTSGGCLAGTMYVYEEAMYWNILSVTLLKNQNWTLQCTAYDGYNYGNSLNSSVTTIQNTPPIATNASITPTTAYSNTTLLGWCAGSDLDINDKLNFTYAWYENAILKDSGSSNGNYNLSTLYNVNNNTMYHSVGSNWTFVCLASDGTNTSNTITSTKQYISDMVPIAYTARYTPSLLYINTTLMGYCNITHPDSTVFNVSYNWYEPQTCYQENANVNNQTGIDGSCGQNYNGTYGFYNGGITSLGILYINYTKPLNTAHSGVWQIKHGTNGGGTGYIYNITLPNGCFNQNILQLGITSQYDEYSSPICYNGTNWENIGNNYSGSSVPGVFSVLTAQSTKIYDGNYSTSASYWGLLPGDSWAKIISAGEYINMSSDIYEEGIYWQVGNIISNGTYINASNGETNINNFTLTNTEYSKNIQLSCQGYDGFGTGNTVNSTQFRVNDIIVYNTTYDNSTNSSPDIGSVIQLNSSITNRDYTTLCRLEVNDTGTWRYPTDYVNTVTVNTNNTNNYNLPFTLYITNSVTSVNSNVSWRVECNDSYNTTFTSNKSVFNVKDTSYPVINISGTSFNINTNNMSIISGDTYNLTYNITYTDYNLFAMEVNVSCNKSGQIYYFTDVALFGLQSYNKFDDVPLNGGPLEKCTFFTAVSDSHTDEEIPAYQNAIIDNGLSFCRRRHAQVRRPGLPGSGLLPQCARSNAQRRPWGVHHPTRRS